MSERSSHRLRPTTGVVGLRLRDPRSESSFWGESSSLRRTFLVRTLRLSGETFLFKLARFTRQRLVLRLAFPSVKAYSSQE